MTYSDLHVPFCRVSDAKVNLPKWGEVIKSPVRYLLDARDYHDATCNCLFEVRVGLCRTLILLRSVIDAVPT